MHTLTPTTTLLLEGLLDPANAEVWLEFDGRFRPVLTAFARRMGVGELDAEDVAQETLARFVKGYRAGQYERCRGRLSNWIVGIARHCALDLQQSRARRGEWRGESALVNLADDSNLESIWDEECRRAVVEKAMRELREDTRFEPRTIRAFELVALDSRPPVEVAAELALNVNSVYTAKNRCISHLREVVARLNTLYEVA